ncbi:type III secretion system gatekeeper subunit SctW [Stenotrophomonas sp.]|uniref:type III secretion system gatekeeper subunit SctW n=1 Tax=Stenotrophomonas sp. TaxID=69392 RepID=UPI002FC62895
MAMPIPVSSGPSLPAALARPAARAADADAARDEPASTTAPARRPGVLSMALNMQDDLSALVASLQRRRDGAAQAARGESAAWIDHVLDDSVHDKLAQLRQALVGVRGVADALALLRGLFPDPSDALAVLRALLADDELEELRELLAASMAALLLEQQAQGTAAAVRGGMNVAVKARLAAQGGLLSARQLRHSYRDFLLSGRDCLGEYARWIALYGFPRRGLVVDFMEQAVGADMYALDPSGAQLDFGHLLRRVRNLAVLRSADELLLQHCVRQRLLQRLQVQADTVITALLAVLRGLEDWSSLFSGPLAAARTVLGPAERSQWIQGLHHAVRALPDDAWPDLDGRDQAIAALDALLAGSVARERLRLRPLPKDMA